MAGGGAGDGLLPTALAVLGDDVSPLMWATLLLALLLGIAISRYVRRQLEPAAESAPAGKGGAVSALVLHVRLAVGVECGDGRSGDDEGADGDGSAQRHAKPPRILRRALRR